MIFLLITIGWMAMIFFMSAQTADTSSQMSSGISAWVAKLLRPDYQRLPEAEALAWVDTITTVIRKLAHFTEYTILGIWLSIDFRFWKNDKTRGLIVFPWLIGSFYAVTDELHQLFVPGRSGEVFDVMIDAGGVLLGCVLVAGAAKMVSGKAPKEAKT